MVPGKSRDGMVEIQAMKRARQSGSDKRAVGDDGGH